MKMKHFAFLTVFSILALAFLSQVDAASPKVTLQQGHIPTYHNIKYVWYYGEGPLPVTLSFTGPWDLTTGPKKTSGPEVLVKPEDAYDASEFPDATFVLKAYDGAYHFYTKTNVGVDWLGSTAPPGHPMAPYSPHTYTPPFRQLILPSTVGSQFVETMTITDPTGSKTTTVTLKIVGKGKVIVGAGTFNDAVMVQGKVTPTYGTQGLIVYQWYAPFVGKVAEISSLDGEMNELFTTAGYIIWLKSCTMP